MALLQSEQKLQTGDQAPVFDLLGVDGTTYNLDSFPDAKVLLIVFMCNHCPYVVPKIEVMNALYSEFKDRGFMLIGINPNDAENYPEDSYEAMQIFVEKNDIKYPYLYDETQGVAKAYGAVCTPDPFLFNKDRKLVYQGRFDDAINPDQTPTTRDMADAIQAILDGKKPAQPFLFSQGCSIKWK